MLCIGICDDSADARLNLRSIIESIAEAKGPECQIYEFSSGEGLLGFHEKHAGELNLVFLDIEMRGITGMETANRLRAGDDSLQMVFVTGFADYVFDGYSVGALGYIMKPPKPRQVEDIITRAAAALHKQADRVFQCRSGDVHYRIPLKDILYFYSDRRQVCCVAKKREYAFYDRLDEVEKQAPGFVRIHQRYLVNPAAVEQVESGQVTVGGTALPVSRSCQAEAMLALTRAMLEV